tara:strand:+ start:1288 stop:1785 length:498 start_codon:yes stop_codon:yes gene_type:complete
MKLTIAAALLAASPATAYAGEILATFGNFDVEQNRRNCAVQTQNQSGDALNIIFGFGRLNLIVSSDDLKADYDNDSDLMVPFFVDDKVWRLVGEKDSGRGAIWIGTQNSLSTEDRLELMGDLMDGNSIGFLVMASGETVYNFNLHGSGAAMKFALNNCLPILMGN